MSDAFAKMYTKQRKVMTSITRNNVAKTKKAEYIYIV